MYDRQTLAGEHPDNTMQWRDGEHFADCLRRRGYRRLGSGDFSSVFVKGDSDRVIKVNFYPAERDHTCRDTWRNLLVILSHSAEQHT